MYASARALARTCAHWERTVDSASAAVSVSVTTKTSGRICAATDLGGHRKSSPSACARSGAIWASNDSRIELSTLRRTSAPWSGSRASNHQADWPTPAD